MTEWISRGTDKPFYAAKTFILEQPAVRAIAKAVGLGQFSLHVNGLKAGDHELDPAWTDYRKRIDYVTFDITDLLKTGTNVIGAEIGNGWFIKEDEPYTFALPAFMGENPNPYHPFAEHLVFRMELDIVLLDGSECQIVTDGTWKTADHPCTMSNVFGSETYDARRPEWHFGNAEEVAFEPAHIEAGLELGRLVPAAAPALKVIGYYEGKLVGTAHGHLIYDFGQNMSGILDVVLRGTEGVPVSFAAAEKLDESGDIDQDAKGWCTVSDRIDVIPDGETVHYRMKFTYFGGRYMAVYSDAPFEIVSIGADAISAGVDEVGSFSCSDPRFGQVLSLVERAVEANLLSVHTDCPAIERFAWQETNHLMAPSIFFMKDGRQLWRKYLQDMRDGQIGEGDTFFRQDGTPFSPGAGLVPSQCPCYVPNVLPVEGMGSFFDSPAWGSASILAAWWHYWFYGEKDVIQENYAMGKRYVAHLLGMRDADGFLTHGLGDWGNPSGVQSRANIDTAFLFADLKAMAMFAEILGRDEDAAAFQSSAEAVRQNYNARLLVRDGSGRWFYKSTDAEAKIASCQALPLFWGMCDRGCRGDVEEAFREAVHENGFLSAGEIALPYILAIGDELDMDQEIADAALSPRHPSYFAFVEEGLTTLGEYWEQNPRSHCHDMMGAIAAWHYACLAGIHVSEPGFARVLIRPYLPESADWLDCSYRSVRGVIRVRMERQEEIRLRVQVPDGIQAVIDTARLESQGPVSVQRENLR